LRCASLRVTYEVSIWKVDDLVRAFGVGKGISKSEVSRIRQGLDEEVSAFRDRSLTNASDATHCTARVNDRIVSKAIIVAIGVSSDGLHEHSEVLGMDMGDSEDGAFWTAFLPGLKARGLGGVHLDISADHAGLKQATAAIFQGSAWQRCRVHFMRNVLSAVPRGSSEMVAAGIRIIFAKPDPAHVSEQFDVIVGRLKRKARKVESIMHETIEDLLVCAGFPPAHWRQIWSNKPWANPFHQSRKIFFLVLYSQSPVSDNARCDHQDKSDLDE
jgi:putative transposase